MLLYHEIKSMQGDPSTYVTSSLKSMELHKFKITFLEYKSSVK